MTYKVEINEMDEHDWFTNSFGPDEVIEIEATDADDLLGKMLDEVKRGYSMIVDGVAQAWWSIENKESEGLTF